MKQTKDIYEEPWDKSQTLRQHIVDCSLRNEKLTSILRRIRKKYPDFPDLTERDIEEWQNSTEV